MSSAGTDRAGYVLALSDAARTAALIRLAYTHPDIFDEVVWEVPVRESAFRAHLERRPGRGPEDNDDGV